MNSGSARRKTGYEKNAQQVEDELRAKYREPHKPNSHQGTTASVNLEALPATVETLNILTVFGGRVRFESVRRRGPMIIATTTEGREIVWPTTKELGAFSSSQAIIADATNIHLPSPPHRLVKATWDAAAALILRIASGDAQTLEPPLKEETRELLRLMWRAAGQPLADDSEQFIDIMRAVLRSRRDPQGTPPPCVFIAEESAWVHAPTFRAWLFIPSMMNKLYPLADIRNGLLLLGFTYIENLTRGADGDSETCCLWRGPLDTLA